MADSSSYRSSRGSSLPPRRDDSDPARHAVSDPLAELARLIGQDEAFGVIVRSSRQEPQPQPEAPPPELRGRGQPVAPREERTPAPSTYRYPETRHTAEPAPRDHGRYAPDAPPQAPVAYEPHDYAPAPPAAQPAGQSSQAQAEAAAYGHDAGGEYYGEGDGQEGHYEGEDEYADPVPQRRHGAIVMVAAVVGLALVGTAGAFGYWAWSTGPRGEPPLIKADTAPNKVVPAAPADGTGSKRVYDRFSDQSGSTERVVSREETPVDIKSAPRQVYPSAGGVYGRAPGQPAPAQPMAAAPAAAPPSGVSANGEPRKVHTETIRPNQVAAADIGQPVAPPLAAIPAAPPVAAPPPPAPAAPPAPVRQVAPKPKQAPQVAMQSPAAQPTETAAVPPAREAAAAGGYVVQLSSQKTEDEARASFKVLAAKYASVFGDREPLIKRVTIPDKGTFYRANVGPFATATEANHFCSNLKIVGGQCIVQKN